MSISVRESRFSPLWLAAVVAVHAVGLYWLMANSGTALPPPVERPILVSLITPAAETSKPARAVPLPPVSKQKPVQQTAARKPVEMQQSLAAAPVPSSAPATTQQAVLPAEAPLPAPDSAPEATPPAAAEAATQPEPIEPPRFNANYLDNPRPAYPSLSRRLGEEGRVLLRVEVDTGGRPANVVLHKSSGHLRLDEAAVETVLRWKFLPAHQGGQPVAAWVIVPIQFSLRG